MPGRHVSAADGGKVVREKGRGKWAGRENISIYNVIDIAMIFFSIFFNKRLLTVHDF